MSRRVAYRDQAYLSMCKHCLDMIARSRSRYRLSLGFEPGATFASLWRRDLWKRRLPFPPNKTADPSSGGEALAVN